MIVYYHGSDQDITSIDLDRCKSGKDFGKGFYLTKDKTKAIRMSMRTARINGTEPVLNTFAGPDFENEYLNELDVKVFNGITSEWAEFVYKNREIRGFAHNYDIVIGPTADDDMRTQFLKIDSAFTDFDSLAKSLAYKQTDIQFCLCTEKSLKYIEKV